MPVNHTEWCSVQIEFYKVQWFADWMGYTVGVASVMDYQALFQESIQRETLLDKRLDVSFQTAGTPLAYRAKMHPPVPGWSCIQHTFIQSQLSNWIVFIYLIPFFFH